MRLITASGGLPQRLAASLSPEEAAYIEKIRISGGLPFAVTPHFASLARPEADDPIRRQFMPDPLEEGEDPFALEDPLGEGAYRALPRLVHQYRDRVLLKTTGNCGGCCRFCFRRAWMAGETPFIPEEETRAVLAWLKPRPQIREILLSGGDPLSAPDKAEKLITLIRREFPSLRIRVCTRIPITGPSWIDRNFIAFLRAQRPLRVALHLNHPRELSPESRAVLTGLVEAGIPVHVQTVLLRGINDRAETLAGLFEDCLELGLSPYYLFQLDLAPGTAHFRVPLRKGLALYRELKLLVSGLALPAYALDLPGGGGKVRLHEGLIAGEKPL
ncbi:MAG: KamA family radical SAM protein, partial [Spirochaetaceae bacterium]|nr:KamA family radical SAM protein [Spirochaetaceae bacterium]